MFDWLSDMKCWVCSKHCDEQKSFRNITGCLTIHSLEKRNGRMTPCRTVVFFDRTQKEVIIPKNYRSLESKGRFEHGYTS